MPVPIKNDIATPLTTLIQDYMESAGTDLNGAYRDILTQLRRFCRLNEMDFKALVKASGEVFAEETDV